MRNVPIEVRFATKFAKIESGCWEWIASIRSTDGYGLIWRNGKHVKAHRVAFELFVGPVPKHLFVCHTCDNRKCVNPNHLFLGTAKDNLRDMAAKGRQHLQVDSSPIRGERNGFARLTNEQAADIKALLNRGDSVKSIAQEFGVHHDTIYRIKRGHGWKHIQAKGSNNGNV